MMGCLDAEVSLDLPHQMLRLLLAHENEHALPIPSRIVRAAER
jgi:hypothetical protein